MLCTCACSPTLMSATALPMSKPYLMTVSPLLDRLGGELVPDRNVVQRLHLDGGVVLHHPAGQLLPGLDAFDDGDADGVLLVVNQKVNHVLPDAFDIAAAQPPRGQERMGYARAWPSIVAGFYRGCAGRPGTFTSPRPQGIASSRFAMASCAGSVVFLSSHWNCARASSRNPGLREVEPRGKARLHGRARRAPCHRRAAPSAGSSPPRPGSARPAPPPARAYRGCRAAALRRNRQQPPQHFLRLLGLSRGDHLLRQRRQRPRRLRRQRLARSEQSRAGRRRGIAHPRRASTPRRARACHSSALDPGRGCDPLPVARRQRGLVRALGHRAEQVARLAVEAGFIGVQGLEQPQRGALQARLLQRVDELQLGIEPRAPLARAQGEVREERARERTGWRRPAGRHSPPTPYRRPSASGCGWRRRALRRSRTPTAPPPGRQACPPLFPRRDSCSCSSASTRSAASLRRCADSASTRQ